MDSVQTDGARARARDRRKRVDVVVLTVVAVLVVALLSGAVAVRRGGSPPELRTIRMAGDSEYFSDPVVQRQLERNGFRIEQNRKGTRGIADLPDLATAYDVANAGSDTAADHIISRLRERDHVAASKISPFSSPMVVITYAPIRKLLQSQEIVRKQDNGTLVFDVARYLAFVGEKKKWTDIDPNTEYRSTNRVLISTTDPSQSNSSGMLIAIETYVMNDNAVVNDVAAFKQKPAAELIKSSFVNQGAKAGHTPDLLSLFLRDGMSRYPMGLFYEKDYINTKLQGTATLDNVELLYPNPTVMSDNTFVWWGQAGRDFANLISTDPTLIDLAEQHGYHARTGPGQFVKDMAAKSVTIVDLDDPKTGVTVAPLPTEEILSQLIEELAK